MEKYGTIPPRFTKKWWAHYLYYYKFHIIAVAFFVFMFGSIIYSNVTRVHYDLHISYLGIAGLEEEKQNALSSILEPEIDEITGNDKKQIEYIIYTFDNVMKDDMVTEDEYAYQMKLVAELQGGDSDLYIITETNAEDLAGFGENFMPVQDFAGEGFDENMIKRDANGHPFAISLKNSEVLKSAGINPDNLYLSVRLLYEANKEDEIKVKTNENSIKAAKLLLGV